MKGTIVFLVLNLVLALSAFAGEKGVDVAIIEKEQQGNRTAAALKPAVTEKFEYYDISGNTEQELRRQMARNGTKWDDGKTYDSLTTWNVKWDYDYSCFRGGCTPEGFTTSVHITFRYPRWIKTPDAPQPLLAKWETYMNNLILHENGHRDMAVEAAADLMSQVAAMPPAANRAELDRNVESLIQSWNAKLNADARQYDATTIHGTTQGAVFP